ncbi:MAG: hypothetical protein HC831_16560 [Chloroflexia bacterium]|nr:hypothetical protein [Chloroflexia bacterium]
MFIQRIRKDLNLGDIQIKPKAVELGGVTVTARSVFRKDGVRMVIPGAEIKKTSTNAIMVLERMNLPRLNVDAHSNSIQIPGGGEVKVCINGREVSMVEISSLQPSEIIRIEYHDKPEARYNYAPVVLDFNCKPF